MKFPGHSATQDRATVLAAEKHLVLRHPHMLWSNQANSDG